jgi:transglutaminase-like putative cysteine protease
MRVLRARPALLALIPALVIAQNWLRLESPQRDGGRAFLLVVLAVTPALAPRVWQRLVVLFGAAVAATVIAVRVDPRAIVERHHDYFGPLASRVGNGVLGFYDVRLPLNPFFHPEMHAVILVAAFAFSAALALTAASRRPLASVVVLLVGATWPATLLSDGRDLLRGAVILASALLLLAGFRADARRTLLRAVLLGAALVAVALAATTQPAVAKGQFLHWQQWDLYTKPPKSVGVRYVWNSSYTGFRFPSKVTTVFKVKAPPRSVYWRSTTLDSFNGFRWMEDLHATEPVLFSGRTDLTANDPLAPEKARDPKSWRRATIEILGLADDHLVAPSVPVAYGSGFGEVSYAQGAIGIVAHGLHRGVQYDTWSYSPQPTPAQLARSKPEYPPQVTRYLELITAHPAAPFGAPDRRQAFERLLADPTYASYFDAFRPLYEKALAVIGRARSPYGAAVALESWFRQTGNFVYTQQPPRTRPNLELVDFLRTKRGYCQHFAGAMALMLRSLGVPARVAAGFTSGTYDSVTGTWTVTDHDAHAWVEVWFRGYGWLPFDPTPGRGSLSAPYTASSASFDPAAAAAIVAGAFAKALSTFNIHQEVSFGEKGIGSALGSADARRAPAAIVTAERGGSLGALLGVALAIVLLLVALAKAARRRARYASRDPRRVAAACRAELRDFLADQGVPVPASAGPQDIVRGLRERLQVDAAPFARALAVARFGVPEDAVAAADDAKRELATLEKQIRSRLGVLRRARGLVSLRSLGFAS